MSDKEKRIVEKLKDAIPKMSDFDKGYILGKVEGMANEKDAKKEQTEQEMANGRIENYRV